MTNWWSLDPSGGPQDGWPTTQLPFLAFGVLHSLGALEGVLPDCRTQHKCLESRSRLVLVLGAK
jgi:hypothetical protein